MACSFTKMRALYKTVKLSKLHAPVTCCCGVNLQFTRHSQRIRQPPQPSTGKRMNKRLMKLEKKDYEVEQVLSEEFLAKVPQDDVWLQSEYPMKQFTFLETLAMHREFCTPEMFNSMDGLVQFEADLDFRTKKKTKFMQGIKNTVVLPHQFEDQTENTIVAICKTQDEKDLAERAGAYIAGGVDIIKAFENKEIRFEDFNHLVCTMEMLPELGAIRKLLRDRFPNKKAGTVSTDIEAIVRQFSLGKNYQSKKIREDTGRVIVNIGRLDMVDELLVANFEFYLEELCSNRRNPKQGKFIKLGKISVLPSTGESFHLHPDQLWPPSQRKIIETIPEDIEQEEEEEVVVEVDSDDEGQSQKVKAR